MSPRSDCSNFGGPNERSSGSYQLMEASGCYCQCAATRVLRSRSHFTGMWVAVRLDNNPELTRRHAVEQYRRSLWVNSRLQVHCFPTKWPPSSPTAEPRQECPRMHFYSPNQFLLTGPSLHFIPYVMASHTHTYTHSLFL